MGGIADHPGAAPGMIGGLLGGTLFGVILADLLAFYSLSSIYAYSFDTALLVFCATFVYVQLAWWVTQTKEASENYRAPALRRLHLGASKWLWNLLWAVMLVSLPTPWIADVFAKKTVRYVELAGTWEWQGLGFREGGSDSTSFPQAETSPLLRDIRSGDVIAAFDGTGKSEGFGLIRQRGIEIKYNDCRACPQLYSIRQARVHLETTLFGRNKIVAVDYVDFDRLPQRVQESVVRRMGQMRSAVLPLWHLGKAHPELAELIEQSMAAASALEK